MATAADDDAMMVWRFGYGSNIGLETLRTKKNLHPSRYLAGTIEGWELHFESGNFCLPFVEPAWACVRSNPDCKVHGSAFCIRQEEADALDTQERGYQVVPSRFVAYSGEVVEEVGLYVPPSSFSREEGAPSLRYLRLVQKGAREAGLSQEWIQRLDGVKFYTTPPEIRRQTERWISEFHSDPARRDRRITAEALARMDGRNNGRPACTSIIGYVVEIPADCLVIPSWKGHTITRRILLHWNGKSLDRNDIRFGQPGFRPLPKLEGCTKEEKEFLFQNLDSLLHRGGTIVARLQDFLDDQELPKAYNSGNTRVKVLPGIESKSRQ